MRAFIALELSDEVRAGLAQVEAELARCPAKVRWVVPANIHVTLKFLGDIGDETAESVKGAMALARTDGGGPIDFTVEGLGWFPPRGTPRIVWAGMTAGTEAVVRLQERLERALLPLGFAKERGFVPHLTLGRVKAPKGAEALADAVTRHARTRFGPCRAAEMVLFESTLTPSGSIYTAAARRAL